MDSAHDDVPLAVPCGRSESAAGSLLPAAVADEKAASPMGPGERGQTAIPPDVVPAAGAGASDGTHAVLDGSASSLVRSSAATQIASAAMDALTDDAAAETADSVPHLPLGGAVANAQPPEPEDPMFAGQKAPICAKDLKASVTASTAFRSAGLASDVAAEPYDAGAPLTGAATGGRAAAAPASNVGASGEERDLAQDERHPGPDGINSLATTAAHRATTSDGAHGLQGTARAGDLNAGPPVDRAHLALQVADHMEAMRITNGRQEVVLRLSPEHLGDVRLTVTGWRDTIAAQIVTSSAAARDAVEGGREHLRAALEQKGFTLQGLDVSLHQNAPQRHWAALVTLPSSRRADAADRLSESGAPDGLITSLLASLAGRAAVRADGRLDYRA